jgi:hypothetical protein
MGSLEKGRKLLEQKGPAPGLFSFLIVTGTAMLNLLSPTTVKKTCRGVHGSGENSPHSFAL